MFFLKDCNVGRNTSVTKKSSKSKKNKRKEVYSQWEKDEKCDSASHPFLPLCCFQVEEEGLGDEYLSTCVCLKCGDLVTSLKVPYLVHGQSVIIIHCSSVLSSGL